MQRRPTTRSACTIFTHPLPFPLPLPFPPHFFSLLCDLTMAVVRCCAVLARCWQYTKTQVTLVLKQLREDMVITTKPNPDPSIKSFIYTIPVATPSKVTSSGWVHRVSKHKKFLNRTSEGESRVIVGLSSLFYIVLFLLFFVCSLSTSPFPHTDSDVPK